LSKGRGKILIKRNETQAVRERKKLHDINLQNNRRPKPKFTISQHNQNHHR